MPDNEMQAGWPSVASDDVGGVKYQIIKLAHGALDSATIVSTASGLPVNIVASSVGGDATAAKQDEQTALLTTIDGDTGNLAGILTAAQLIDNIVKLEDDPHSTGDAGIMMLAVRQDVQSDLAADGDYIPLTIDGDGNLRVTSAAGSGTSAADDADFTAGTTPGTPAMGVYESTPTSVTDGDLGTVGITQDRALRVNVDNAGSIGGGVQYTEAATDASITGTAMLMEGAADALVPVQGTAADGMLVNLGGNNDVTVTGTVDLGATDNAVLDAIAASVATMDDWDESDRAKVNPIVGVAGVAAGSGASGTTTQRVIVATDALAAGRAAPPDVDVTTHTRYMKKYYTSAGAATDGIIWSPAAGTRWHVVSMFINISAAATLTLEDDKSGGDEAVMKMELAANSGFTLNFSELYPLCSGEDAADLTVTTTAGNVYVTVTGYEI